jgi:hypothetical protein
MSTRLVLNTAAVDQLVREAGLSDTEFARSKAQIHPITYSRARNGRAMRPSTLRAIALGLTRIKPMKGFEKLPGGAVIAKEKAEAQGIATSAQEVDRASGQPS